MSCNFDSLIMAFGHYEKGCEVNDIQKERRNVK